MTKERFRELVTEAGMGKWADIMLKDATATLQMHGRMLKDLTDQELKNNLFGPVWAMLKYDLPVAVKRYCETVDA